ncbi:MAG: fatty acid desaturase [Deltaproteobacteria bacterium]|nr:fatty acid desaturase [Deltaproteobacteria bacterium]
MRTGPELVRATRVFAEEDPRRTWRLFLASALVHLLAVTATLLAPWWPLKLVGSVVIGLSILRLFIFYHDYLHGAVFRGSRLGKLLMWVVGAYVQVPPSVWKETHDYHHRNNAKLLGSAIGSYPVVTVGMWKGMSLRQRRAYAVVRSPVTMALGHVTLFALGMCLSAFRRDPTKHWQAPLVLVLWWSVLVAIAWVAGWQNALFVFLLPGMIASALGAYLFYAQHNFPRAELRDRREWDYSHAALRCSSMFDMGPVMHWFTGNIGYHHVHHLNHRIPFYRLPEAMAGMPELQDPPRTSWRPPDVWGCLRVALWDPEGQRMVSYREAEQLIAHQNAA